MNDTSHFFPETPADASDVAAWAPPAAPLAMPRQVIEAPLPFPSISDVIRALLPPRRA